MSRYAPEHWSTRRMVKDDKMQAPYDTRSVGIGWRNKFRRLKPVPQRSR